VRCELHPTRSWRMAPGAAAMRRAARSDAVGRAGPPTTARIELTGGRRAETDSGSPGV
jgi:hypothetical protein